MRASDGFDPWNDNGNSYPWLFFASFALYILFSSCAICSENRPCQARQVHQEAVSRPICLISCNSDFMCVYETNDNGLIYAGYTDQVSTCAQK